MAGFFTKKTFHIFQNMRQSSDKVASFVKFVGMEIERGNEGYNDFLIFASCDVSIFMAKSWYSSLLS